MNRDVGPDTSLRPFGEPPWVFAGVPERDWERALGYAHVRQDRARDFVKDLWHRGRVWYEEHVTECDAAEKAATEAERVVWSVWNGDLGTIRRLIDQVNDDPDPRVQGIRERKGDGR